MSLKVKVRNTMTKCVLNSLFGSHSSEAGIHLSTIMMVAKHMHYDCTLQWSSSLSARHWVRHCRNPSLFAGPSCLDLPPPTSHSASDPSLPAKMDVWLHTSISIWVICLFDYIATLDAKPNGDLISIHFEVMLQTCSWCRLVIISVSAYMTFCISSKCTSDIMSRVTARVRLLVLTCLTCLFSMLV